MVRVVVVTVALLVAACATGGARPEAAIAPLASVEREARSDAMTWEDVEALTWPSAQEVFSGYRTPAKNALWAIYADGGVELYCRERFSAAHAAAHRVRTLVLSWEHAYPAVRAARALGYSDRDCRRRLRGESAEPDDCLAATGDLHNLWPAFARINSSRADHPFAELEGEGTTSDAFAPFCPDYERGRIGDSVYVEPTADARGDIARALIYMHMVYELPLEEVIDDPDRLLEWAHQDRVDSQERARERKVRALQGTWNPLVLPPPAE